MVIGAGQAGLSSAYFLRRAGFEPEDGYVVLDGDRAPGGAWQHRWPTLRMDTVNGIFDLPGMAFDPPSGQERAAVAIPRYFARFEQEFQLAVHRPVAVRAVRHGPRDRLLVESDAGTWAVRAARRDGVLDRLPMFDRITPDGVAWDGGGAQDGGGTAAGWQSATPRFVQGDVILWCTGWRAALDHLAPLHLRAPGGGIAVDGTRAVLEPRLHLVGYGPSASTVGANRAGREAVREIRRLLSAPTAPAVPTAAPLAA